MTAMTTLFVCLAFLLAVVMSEMLARVLPPALPKPVVQIAFGAGIGLVPEVHVVLQPDFFLLLFVPPLLFLDGWRIPKDDLMRDRRIVLGLALGLVFFTVLGAGLFTHWLIPTMPLPVCFALAAVLSPTDPIALAAIGQRITIPKRLLHILEGEALFNDASGLVCLRFAVAAVLTGSFSLSSAGLSFLWVATAGVACGVLTTLVLTRLTGAFARRFGQDTGSSILISLLIPFASYLMGEYVGGSGVLAAATAGIAMSVGTRAGVDWAETRLRGGAVWDMIRFTLNGVVFVLLGEQLPTVLDGLSGVAASGTSLAVWQIGASVTAIVLVIYAMRFVWVWAWLKATLFKGPQDASPLRRSLARIAATMTCAGTRGAITLAGVMSLPLTLKDGTPFPARDLAIAIAACVILASFAIASLGLPRLLRGLHGHDEEARQSRESNARVVIARAALQSMEDLQRTLSPRTEKSEAVASAVTDFYRTRVERAIWETTNDRSDDSKTLATQMRRAGASAERRALSQLARDDEVDEETRAKLIREIDVLEEFDRTR